MSNSKTIPMSQVRKRISGLNNTRDTRNVNARSMYESLKTNGYDFNKVINIVYNWDSLARDQEYAYDKIIELFDIVEENGSISDIDMLANLIVENVQPSVINQKKSKETVTTKMNVTKKAIANIKRNISDIKAAPKKMADSIKNNVNKNMNDIKNRVTRSIGKAGTPSTEDKKKAVKEALSQILEANIAYINCDRLISNYNNFSKRFNTSETVSPYKSIEESTKDFCTMIDTYDAPFKFKYNAALESLLYLFDKNISSPYSKSDIITSVTEYFLAGNNFDTTEMEFVLRNNRFLPREAVKESMEIVSSDIPVFFNEATEPFEISKLRKELNRAKIDKEKNPSLLRRVCQATLTDSPRNIVDGTPNLLSWIRVVFIAGTIAINPIIGAIAGLVGGIATIHFEKKELDRLIAAYEKEKNLSITARDKTDDPEKKERYDKYIKELDKAIMMMNNHRDDVVLTDKEKEEKEMESDDMDFSFDEEFSHSAKCLGSKNLLSIATIQTISNQVGKLSELYENSNILDNIDANFDKISNDDIVSLTEFSQLFPDLLDLKEFKTLLERKTNKIRESTGYDNNISEFIRVDSINEAIFSIESMKKKQFDKFVINEYNIDDCIMVIEMANSLVQPVLELSITNTFKLAVEKLKKGVQNLSTKEKEACKTIDAIANTMIRSAEQTLKNDNREAVIRGSLIPSFSKMIKAALGTTVLAAVAGPVIAGIALIGGIAISKKLQRGERQLILDEVQTELKLTQKQIRLAEDNNDMKALKDLYHIERSLQRTEQKIKYHSEIKGEYIPKISKNDD